MPLTGSVLLHPDPARRQWPRVNTSRLAGAADPLPDLGPRTRDGRAPTVHQRHPHPGLLLRPQVTVATRQHVNENTNGLLRQYLPRRVDFRTLTQDDVEVIAEELNERPRQTLGFKTPSQVLAEVLR
jgi:hypothetical protein